MAIPFQPHALDPCRPCAQNGQLVWCMPFSLSPLSCATGKEAPQALKLVMSILTTIPDNVLRSVCFSLVGCVAQQGTSLPGGYKRPVVSDAPRRGSRSGGSDPSSYDNPPSYADMYAV